MGENFVVILAGGKGERFWPQSRTQIPKQLLPIVGEGSLLSQTVRRLQGLIPVENILVLTNQSLREATIQACPELLPENIYGEPCGRDTGPAVGLAALLVLARNPNAIFAILPADHVIHDASGFQQCLHKAFTLAKESDFFVTLGIQPAFPATGYGYIALDHCLDPNPPAIHSIQKFVEKPDLATAESFLQLGNYLWNAGMFIWKASVLLEAFRSHALDIYNGLQNIDRLFAMGSSCTPSAVYPVLQQTYHLLPKISIDYALMEKTTNIRVLSATFDWDDVGEWTALTRHLESDQEGNVTKGLVKLLASRDSIVVSHQDHLVAVYGVHDLVVVHTPDATLVCPKSRVQEIKKLVTELGQSAACRSFL